MIVRCTLFLLILFLSLYGIKNVIDFYKDNYSSDTRSSKEVFEDEWSKKIQFLGAQDTYQQFKETYANTHPSDQHYFAHLFGGVLYETLGLDGLSVCDLYFSSGCFHEFLGQALREHGESILLEVDSYCKESSYDCQHGIGHGILAYQGYEYPDLIAALTTCREIETTDPRDGCFGGIFMEYNMRTMIYPTNLRSVETEAEPHELCKKVPGFAVDACYFWIAQWFIATVEGSLESKFFEATKKCQLIKDTSGRLNCYSGIANEFPSYTENLKVYERHCDNKELSEFDPLYTHQCRAATASILYMDIYTRSLAPQMCTFLEDEALAFCERFARDGDGKRIPPITEWSEQHNN